MPVQTQPLATWCDGSIKWLLTDFILPALEPGTSELILELGDMASNGRSSKSMVRCSEGPGVFVVDTGSTSFEIDRRICRPFALVHEASSQGSRWSGSALLITDRRGRQHSARVAAARVETAGPVRTTICLEGTWDDCRGLRFRCRLSFFADTGLVRLQLTVHNPQRASHRGGMWDLGDRGSFLFRDLSLIVPRCEARGSVLWKAEAQQPFQRLDGGRWEIYQDSSGGDNWRSTNHVNREGWVPCRFQGYQCTAGGTKFSGRRASPVVVVQDGAAQLAASMPEFWQQFPKAIDVDEEALRLRFFPEHSRDLFELQGGERKTHTMWLRFGSSDEPCEDALQWTHEPANVLVSPEWIAATGVMSWSSPASTDVNERFAEQMQAAVTGAQSLIAKREVIDEYGWRNYGDLWADHEGAYYRGAGPVISHYNNQFDVIYGSILQMVRSGDGGWRDVFDPLARHVMDIDIYHTQRDKAAYNGGMFWFTDHYLDAATSTHRTYSRANRPLDGKAYGGGPGSEHNFATGLLYYYYLTGNLDARDAVVGLADWVIAMDDGAKTIFSAIDDGPTGLASLCGSLGAAAPGRGAANSIQTLLDAWTLGGEQHYLTKAEQLIRRCIHPDDDVAAKELLDAEHHWSYTMFLMSLLRYLELKTEARQLDKMFAYTQRCVVRYGEWMATFERPYLDHPDKLEYVTEAWAAQEFRKANVLRLAAQHATGDLADLMWNRGEQLADRAWQDLLGFSTCHYARAVAVLMTEGSHDAYLRSNRPAPSPQCENEYDFGRPAEFRSQKERVLNNLSGMKGILSGIGVLFRRKQYSGQVGLDETGRSAGSR